MKIQWITAALLSSALLVACGDRSPENTQDPEQNAPSAPTAAVSSEPPAPPPVAAPRASPGQKPVATRSRVEESRATSENQALPAPRTAVPAAPSRTGAGGGAREEREIAAPRAATPTPRPAFREVSVPAGTALPLELTTALSSETATVETPVTARLRNGVVVDGVTALPPSSVLHGEVTDVARAGRVQGRSRLAIRFTSVTVDGQRQDLRTSPIIFEGEATKREDATKIGAGAGVGAVVGGIVGGGEGAAKGAAIGGAAGTGVVLATRGREVTLASGTDLAATLASAFEVRVPIP